MSEEQDRVRLRSVVEVSVPRGRAWLLNPEQYQILHAGDAGDLKAWLFLCIGLLTASVEAVLSTIQNVDWQGALAKHNSLAFVHLLIQIGFGAIAIAGLVTCLVLLHGKRSLCSELKTRISQHFSTEPVEEPGAESKPDTPEQSPKR